jgi:DNA-cytosine methyltransferase
MNGLSLFSGIGGFDLAMERAGINLVGMCEIDKNAQNVLRKRFQDVPLFDDVREVGVNTHEKGSVDIICGGFPCQDLSIAGKRAGLAGERSGLWFEFARVIDELEPRWVVIENVPGLLSSDKGQDFAIILRWLVERGYGVSWRILDARYFGVPQRRRRVFVVASFGNGSSAEVLFEREGLPRYPKKGSEARQAAAGTFNVRSGGDGGGKGYLGSDDQSMTLGGQQQWAYNISAFNSNCMLSDNPLSGIQNIDTTRTLDNNGGNPACNQDGTMIVQPNVAHTLRANAKQSLMSGDGVINETLIYANKVANTLAGGSSKAHSDMTSGQQDGNVIVFQPGNLSRQAGANPSNIVPTLGANTQGDQFPHITFIKQRIDEYKQDTVDATVSARDYKSATDIVWQNRQQSGEIRIQDDISPTISSSWGSGGNNVPMVGVRRLTPTECERLQGFPDGWTDGQADTARYKQLGNAVAVPVVQWIIDRIWKHEKRSV